jgi:predicted helicase
VLGFRALSPRAPGRTAYRASEDVHGGVVVGVRCAVEWIIDCYQVKTDKNSGIVNDPNAWSREVDDPRYFLDRLARVVTVSVETMAVIDAMPPLEVR